MNFRHTELQITELRPGHGPSAYREPVCPPPLYRALKRHGQLFPLLVTEGKPGFILVCGHRRAAGLADLGFHSVDVGVITPATDLEILRLSVTDNSTSAGFTDAERIRILNRLFTTCAVAASDVAEHWMPLLSLPASRDLAGKYQRLCSDPALFQAVDTGALPPGTALRILIIPNELRPAVLKLIKTWKLTTSESRECIHILDELIRRDGISHRDIASFSAGHKDMEMLRSIRFPKQARRNKGLKVLTERLPPGCRVRLARSEGLLLEIPFTGIDDCGRKLTAVHRTLDSDESETIVDSF